MSAIDVTQPPLGTPTTAGVRNNFLVAKNELEALQSAMAYAPFLPLAGGTMNGVLTINTNPVAMEAPASGTFLRIRAPDNINARMLLDAIGSAQPVNGAVIGRRASGTAAAPGPVAADQIMLALGVYGRGQTYYTETRGASIEFRAAETWDDNRQGTYLSFWATPRGTNTQQEAMRIADDLTLLIGKKVSTDTVSLEVGGGALFDGLTIAGVPATLILTGLPTAAAGLVPNQVWRNGTVLNIV